MKYKLLPRRVSLLVYDDNDELNYIASCQINITGNRGTIDTLNGKGFYKFLAEKGIQLFIDLELEEIQAAVSPAHLRLMKRSLKNQPIVITEEGGMFNPPLVWIKITKKP